MPLSRRALLSGAAAAAGVLAGCSGGDPVTPRTVPDPEEERIGGSDPSLDGLGGSGSDTETHYVFTPDIRGWDAERADNGDIRLRVEMNNVDPEPIEGRLQATFRINGTKKRYNASFSMAGNESRTVNVTYPVPYETLREGGYLRLAVPVANETG